MSPVVRAWKLRMQRTVVAWCAVVIAVAAFNVALEQADTPHQKAYGRFTIETIPGEAPYIPPADTWVPELPR